MTSILQNPTYAIKPRFFIFFDPVSSSNFGTQRSRLSLFYQPLVSVNQIRIQIRSAMEGAHAKVDDSGSSQQMKLLFVEMGVGYDQHGQDITAAAMRACRDAITSNSIPAFRRGNIPGVSFDQMKLQIKLGVPKSLQEQLNVERVKSVFPYGEIVKFEVADGGLICSSGVVVEEMGDKNDECYIVNAAVYVGY
ncbi:unnamed protein product [Rhodiola kirilowii]